MDYDCIVLGGGPAGSTAAALVAEAGFKTLLCERDKFPRFHVGESLMPETYWTLERLGVLDEMKVSPFPRKYSVQFVSHTGKESAPFYFQKADNRECAVTWQVLRSEFDELLFRNAGKKGADCRDRTRALDVIFEGDKAVGVRIQSAGGEVEEVNAKVVIDATGQQSLLAHRLRLREDNAELRKASIWTYYEGAQRDSGIDEGATIILHTSDKRCWFWYIPLQNDLVSVGLVSDVDYLLKDKRSPADVFAAELENCPAVKQRIEGAQQTSDFRVVRDFSYVSSQPAGQGWVLVGDAFGFLDPIYSSGVFLALKSGEMAADCVIEGLRSGDTSGTQLGKWAPEFLSGMTLIRKLVYAFYTDDFSFGRFIKEHPQHQTNLTDLLVGKVFHEKAGDIFKDMDPWIERIQADRNATAM